MTLQATTYQSLRAHALCADPFVQEWLFHPPSEWSDFFAGLQAARQDLLRELAVVRKQLLEPVNGCSLARFGIERYGEMKRALLLDNRTESRYLIAEEALAEITVRASRYSFQRVTQEIFFYKIIRPLFGQETEYLRLRYHA